MPTNVEEEHGWCSVNKELYEEFVELVRLVYKMSCEWQLPSDTSTGHYFTSTCIMTRPSDTLSGIQGRLFTIKDRYTSHWQFYDARKMLQRTRQVRSMLAELASLRNFACQPAYELQKSLEERFKVLEASLGLLAAKGGDR